MAPFCENLKNTEEKERQNYHEEKLNKTLNEKLNDVLDVNEINKFIHFVLLKPFITQI